MVKFYSQANILIQGPSGAGKTQFMLQVIQQRDRVFFVKPTKVIYIYSNYQPVYDKMREACGDIVFIKHIPSEEQLEDLTRGHNHSILVCDDKLSSVGTTPNISEVFIRLGHHLSITTFVLLQASNLAGSKYAGNIVRNSHYTILFKAGQMAHLIRSLGIRINDYKNLVSAYKLATVENYNYLCVNTHPKASEMERYTSLILPDDPQCLVYKPHS